MNQNINNENILLIKLNKSNDDYFSVINTSDNYSTIDYSTNIRHFLEFVFYLGSDYRELVNNCLNVAECNGASNYIDYQVEKGPSNTVYLYNGIRMFDIIESHCAKHEDAEIYDVLNDSNSIRLTQDNFIDCLKQWDWVEKNKPKYVLFWRKKIGSDVCIETFENGDDVNTRIEELEKIIEK